MSRDDLRPLTKRQQDVMERIDRRAPIKVIARDLGVSETRINQHIRALKNIYSAESLTDLVEVYRKEKMAAAEQQKKSEKEIVSQELAKDGAGLSEAVYNKNQVPVGAIMSDSISRDDPGKLVIRDVSSMVDEAPWLRLGEPQVVPRALDGEHALWLRLVAIVGIAFGFLAAVILTVTAAVTISEALDGVAAIPVDQNGFS